MLHSGQPRSGSRHGHRQYELKRLGLRMGGAGDQTARPQPSGSGV
jgi:hypothetical protein